MLDFRKRLINGALHNVLKRLRCPLEVMFTCVRWYAAYPLSLRHTGEMMQERGILEDHSTVHPWALKMLPMLAAVFGLHKRPRWPARADGRVLYQDRTQMEISLRAVDRMGDTVNFFSSLPSKIWRQLGDSWRASSTKVTPIRPPLPVSRLTPV